MVAGAKTGAKNRVTLPDILKQLVSIFSCIFMKKLAYEIVDNDR